MEQDEQDKMIRIDEFEEKEQEMKDNFEELKNMSGKCPMCDHILELCICDNIEPKKLCPVCKQDLEECICIDIASSASEAAQKLLKNVPPVEEFPTTQEKIVEQLELLNENFEKLLFALECIHTTLSNR